MKRTRINQALNAGAPMDEVLVRGWVRTKREGKGFWFVELNDGSCLANIQVVVDDGVPGSEVMGKVGTGAAVEVRGALVESPGKGQKWEIKAGSVELIGEADPESYPLQKKRHSDEFLRQIAHLRPRTNKYGAMFRIRAEMSYAVHKFFRDRGFYYVHSPIITGSDCEGAGEMFRISSLDRAEAKRREDPAAGDFFGCEAFLTVSGQLSAEIFAQSLGDVYTFGPTFRAEHSDTPRHAAEFWMIEPEMAFCDLEGDMDLAEEYLTCLFGAVLEECPDDLGLFGKFVDKELLATLEHIVESRFERVTYGDAVDILERSGESFEYPVGWGRDLQSEHERYLTEKHFKRPVIVYDYPAAIKAFYMRMNDDGATVAAMDVLAPKIGEIIGGSQREERRDALEQRMADFGLRPEDYWWYLDLRRYGTVPHAGFGLGFERTVQFATGMGNIRDVIPFPRTPKSAEF
jgi:asparaginyl-tRNA synthetase